MSLQAQLAGTAAKQFLGIEDQRQLQMNRIEQKVEAGLAGPYRAGLIHLEEACVADIPAARRDESLKLAEADFIQAIGNLETTDPLNAAWAVIQIVEICKVQNREADACRWAERAHGAARRAVEVRVEEMNDRVDGKMGKRLRLTGKRSQDIAAQATTVGIAGSVVGIVASTTVALVAWPVAMGGAGTLVGVQKFRKMQWKRARDRITLVAEFVAEIAEVRKGLGDKHPPQYELSFGENEYWPTVYQLQEAKA